MQGEFFQNRTNWVRYWVPNFSTAAIPSREITFLAMIFLNGTFHPPFARNWHVGTFTSRC